MSLSNESKPSSVALPAFDTALKGALHRTGAESSSTSGYGPVMMGREVGIRAYAPTQTLVHASHSVCPVSTA